MEPDQVFLNAVQEAEAAVRIMFLAMREAGVGNDSALALRVRSIDTALGDAHETVEENGLTP